MISYVLATACLIVNLALYRVMPTFHEMFQDNTARLPGVTILILSVPRSVWVIVGVLGAMLLVAKDFTVPDRWRGPVNTASCLLVVVYAFGIAISLLSPLVGVMFE